MATLPSKNGAVTLLDMATARGEDGKIETGVVEMLNQTNDILTDMLWKECNRTDGNKTLIRDGLPTAMFRMLYQGVPASKSRRVAVMDTTCMLEARSEIDRDVADAEADLNAFRLSEASSFLEAMNQQFVDTLLYGNINTNQERFLGIINRYNSKGSTAGTNNIISMSGSGNANTSILLVGWGGETVHGIVPKGSKAGIFHEDLGLQDAFDADGNRYRAYCDHWQWKCGLTVKDYRYIVRIGDIDAAALKADNAGTTVRILEAMLKAINRLPSLGMCRPVFYVNRTVKEMIDIHALNRSSNVLTLTEAAGQFKTAFMGIPIRLVDRIKNNEANMAA